MKYVLAICVLSLLTAPISAAYKHVDTQFIDVHALKVLSHQDSPESLTARFGKPLRADRIAIGWPNKRDKHLSSKTEQWKQAYWFFFKLNENGQPEHPLKLDMVASLKPNDEEDVELDRPLFDLFPLMTIDWPNSLKGKNFVEQYWKRAGQHRNLNETKPE